MVSGANLLNDLQIKNIHPQEKEFSLNDGGGLFLTVSKEGYKNFVFRATFNGKRRKFHIGAYPKFTLSEARQIVKDYRLKLNAGEDPTVEKKKEKALQAQKYGTTFEAVAIDWIEIKSREISESTLRKIKGTFNANVYPVIGALPLSKINNALVRRCLEPMQQRGATDLMGKTRDYIRNVFDFALADNLIAENPIPVKDVRLVKHESKKFPRLKSLVDAGELLRNLQNSEHSIEVKTCAALIVHLAQRHSELRLSKWQEFDFDDAVWTLPIDRSKSRNHMDDEKPHTIMLSKQAIKALEALKSSKTNTHATDYVFAPHGASKPFTEASIRKAFRKCFTKYHIVPHGCRHFFSTQANESGKFKPDAIEKFISHKDKNKIRAIYNEATYDAERREIAQWWSDKLDVARDGAEVVELSALVG